MRRSEIKNLIFTVLSTFIVSAVLQCGELCVYGAETDKTDDTYVYDDYADEYYDYNNIIIDPNNGIINNSENNENSIEKEPLRLISSIHHIKYMDGSYDGLFHPERAVTRAEVAQILYSLMEDPSRVTPADNILDAEPGIWYYDAVSVLTGAGVTDLYDTNEYGAGYFRPDEEVSRAQLVYYLSKFSDLAEPQASFWDVPQDHWAYREIMSAAAKGWIEGHEDGSFWPVASVTRAETAVIINRVLGRSGDEDTIYSSDAVRIFPDVSTDYWAYVPIMEASIEHFTDENIRDAEVWTYTEREKTALAPGYYLFDGALYSVSEYTGAFMRNESDGVRYYGNDGKYTSGNDVIDGYVRSITAENTNDGMSDYEKLRTLFNYVVRNYSYVPRAVQAIGATGWQESYAESMFKNWRGNCYSYAAAFYYLSRNLGYEPVVRSGRVISYGSPHGWVEMTKNGQQYVYDPELTHVLGTYIFDIPWSRLPYRYWK